MALKTLDWKKDTLLGYEKSSHFALVEAIRVGIRAGDNLPPFNVFQLDENKYLISYNLFSKDNGGHHRAIAYYKELVNPIVNIVEPFNNNILEVVKMKARPISSVELFDYREIQDSEIRKRYEKQFWQRARNYPRLEEVLSQSQ